jgi:hypothetical protein
VPVHVSVCMYQKLGPDLLKPAMMCEPNLVVLVDDKLG